MRALIRNLPVDSATQRHAVAVVATAKAENPERPPPAKKIDYDALRALGAEVIRIPRAG